MSLLEKIVAAVTPLESDEQRVELRQGVQNAASDSLRVPIGLVKE
jgi:hypothetical protein